MKVGIFWLKSPVGEAVGGEPSGYKVHFDGKHVDVGNVLQTEIDINPDKGTKVSVSAYNKMGESAECEAIYLGKPQAPQSLRS